MGQLTQRGRRAALTLLGFLLASLVLPAATKQWSDRSGELALKKELVSQINATVNRAVSVTDCTARITTCFPEGRTLRDPNAGQPITTEADVTYGRALFESRMEWNAGQASITSVLDAYFSGTAVNREWAQHSEAVSAFMRLSSTECGEAREKDTRYLQGYLPDTDSKVWSLLQTNIGASCTETSIEFEIGYMNLATGLLARTPLVTRALLDSNAAGYSSGTRDFLGDLWPL